MAGCENAQKFDLVCPGTILQTVQIGNVQTTKQIGKQTLRFSVDLDANVYCTTSDCSARDSITSVTPERLRLGRFVEINRISGMMMIDTGPSQIIGQCEKAKFTKPPKAQF